MRQPVIGDRVRLNRDWENYPIFIKEGATGTLTDIQPEFLVVRMDAHHDDLEGWDNELQIHDFSDLGDNQPKPAEYLDLIEKAWVAVEIKYDLGPRETIHLQIDENPATGRLMLVSPYGGWHRPEMIAYGITESRVIAGGIIGHDGEQSATWTVCDGGIELLRANHIVD